MGGLLGLMQQRQQAPATSQAPPDMGSPDPTMAGPAPTQQPQQGQQQGQPQPQQRQDDSQFEALRQSLIQRATPTSAPSGGPVRQALQGFFHNMEQGMIGRMGGETEAMKQQRAIQALSALTSSQSNLELHRAMASQFAPVPLVGMDNKPIVDPTTGKVITLPANHAQTFYAGQAQAAARVQVQGMKDTTATEVQGMRGDTAETVQELRNQAQAAQTSSKLDMFRQTQKYNVWKTGQDNQTKLQVAQMTGNKAPAAIMQTAAFAQGGLSMLDDADQAMQRLEARGVLGNVASNKIEDWIFGKGLVDPTLPAQDKEDIGKLRAAATFTSSAAMRAHTGRSSKEIYDDFKNTMGINQGPDAWKGAMQETRRMLGQYSEGATNAAIQKLRGLGNQAPQNSQGGPRGRRVIDLTK